MRKLIALAATFTGITMFAQWMMGRLIQAIDATDVDWEDDFDWEYMTEEEYAEWYGEEDDEAQV